MELKEYQQGVLSKLDRYLAVLSEKREDAEAFVEFQRSAAGKPPSPTTAVRLGMN